ncbi:hypothetical protein AB1Y20_003005 [Prymnesium parvum]|uniref:Uncharacterized protein n=1 Tax=Prymnesium parvum TaxID=97485 RepID=A0AB34JB59_PRYPA
MLAPLLLLLASPHELSLPPPPTPPSSDAALQAAHARLHAAWAGLHAYFYDEGGFWKCCGQTGGSGGAAPFDCRCEPSSPFCTHCFRWWMAVGAQSLVSASALTNLTNATDAVLREIYAHSPYTSRFQPSWAYIDDYLWYVLLWLDVSRWSGRPPLTDFTEEAAATFDQMYAWGADEPCGGIVWLYPDADPQKNAVTVLEAVQASAQLALRLAGRPRDARGEKYRARAVRLWAWFEQVQLLDGAGLVQDHVSGAAHGARHCCNRTAAPVCLPRNTTRWSYNQGLALGAAADLFALTKDERFLRTGARVLEAVLSRMTRTGGATGGRVLTETVPLTVTSAACDETHDPSAPAGGDLYSFKAVFMQQLPRFLEAAAHMLEAPLREAAVRLVSDSADEAWATRAVPPFSPSDVCNEFRHPPLAPGGPPKFTWDWGPAPSGLTCMDARTQFSAFSLFVADLRIKVQAKNQGW